MADKDIEELRDILKLISKNVITGVNNLDVINNNLLKFKQEFEEAKSLWIDELNLRLRQR